MSDEVIEVVGSNPLQGRNVNGKVYLSSKAIPDSVICIACGMNVRVPMIDAHHIAHQAHRDHTLPEAMDRFLREMQLDSGQNDHGPLPALEPGRVITGG